MAQEFLTERNNLIQVGGEPLDLGQTTKGASLPVTLASDQGALSVDGSGVTQPVSAAALPLPSGAATSAKQSDGSQKTQVVDGSGNVIGSTANALDVNIKSGAGGGVSAVDDATFTAGSSSFAPIGGVFNDAVTAATSGHTDAARITAQRAIHTNLRNNSGTEIGVAATPLQVSLANTATNATAVKVDGSGVTQPVSGTVTANAGTNLNTSALALETGGNLATIAGAVSASVVQTNVKQVNGVTTLTGNGITGAGSQRVTVASDNTPFAVKTDQTTHGTTDLVAADITKVAGSAISQGHGTAATAIRVELPTDGTGVVGLAAGSAVIGHVIADSGSTTAVTQATAANLKAQVAQLASVSTSATLQNTVSATGNGSTLNTDGMSAVVFTITGTFTATVFFEGTEDGSNYTALSAVNVGTATIATSTTTTGVWEAPCAGMQNVRARVTWTSGTSVTVTAHAVPVTYSPKAVNANLFTGGSAVNTGHGTASGSIRVELPTDGTGVVGLAAGANTIGSLAANQSVNVAQINGHTALEGGTNGAQAIGGTVATNVAITANPINLGAQAVSSENSAVTTARQVQLVADLVGKLITLPYANPENFVNGTTAAITDTTSTSVIASAGGSLRNYITSILVTNSHATVGTFVKILDGATIIYEGYAAAAGGGFSASLPVPLRGTAATAVNAQCVTTGANVIVSCAGYKGV